MELTEEERGWIGYIQVMLRLQEAFCDTDNEGYPWDWLLCTTNDDSTTDIQEESIPYGESPISHRPLQMVEELHLESPIERAFWNEWSTGPQYDYPLVPQFRVGRYRLDFAHPASKTAIELDGHATHSSPDAIAKDRRRQRDLERQGWHVIRFGGKEIYRDVSACVLEAWELLSQRTQRSTLEEDRRWKKN